MVKFIYQFNPDIYVYNHLAFMRASSTGNIDLVKWLLQFNPTCDQAMFQNSLLSGNLELIKFLHKPEHYILPDDYYNVSVRGFIHVVEYLNPTLLYPQTIDKMFRFACINNHFKLAKYLLQFNPDVKSHNFYALRCASEDGNEDMVKFLVEFKPSDDQFESAIIRAYQNDNNAIYDFLIEKYGTIPDSLKNYQ